MTTEAGEPGLRGLREAGAVSRTHAAGESLSERAVRRRRIRIPIKNEEPSSQKEIGTKGKFD